MKQIAVAILKKEVREVLRDKRTLFLALFLPLLFYPVLMGVSVSVSKESVKGEPQDELMIAHDGSGALFEAELKGHDSMSEVAELIWHKVSNSTELNEVVFSDTSNAEAVLPEDVDAGLFWDENNKIYKLLWKANPRGERARALLSNLLESLRKRVVELALKKNGMELTVLEPFSIQEINITPVRQQMGRKMGGVGAYFMIFLAFTGCMSVAVDAGAGERERGTMEAMMLSPSSFMGIALGKFMFVLLMGGFSVLATFVGMGSMLLFDERVRIMAEEFMDMESMLMLLILMLGVVFVFASLLYCIALMAKSAREAHLRSSLVMMLLAVGLILSGSEIVYSSVWVNFFPVMNTAVVISKVIAGMADWFLVSICLIFSIVTGILPLWFVSIVFKRCPERSYLTE